MKILHFMWPAILATVQTLADEPAVARAFDEIASDACKDRNRHFVVQGRVSRANENTLVLSAPTNPRRTVSIWLPGRGPLARIRGAFGKSREERVDEVLNELRDSDTLVVVTAKCKGNATPVVRTLNYRNTDGSEASVSY